MHFFRHAYGKLHLLHQWSVQLISNEKLLIGLWFIIQSSTLTIMQYVNHE